MEKFVTIQPTILLLNQLCKWRYWMSYIVQPSISLLTLFGKLPNKFRVWDNMVIVAYYFTKWGIIENQPWSCFCLYLSSSWDTCGSLRVNRTGSKIGFCVAQKLPPAETSGRRSVALCCSTAYAVEQHPSAKFVGNICLVGCVVKCTFKRSMVRKGFYHAPPMRK